VKKDLEKTMIKLNRDEYLSKVSGCWMGKNIGGTLGAPFEWRRQVNNVSFYTQDLGGEPLPNDDLDLQLVWLAALEEKGVRLDAHTLAEYWCLYVTPHWAEYGTGKQNLRSGLQPPISGTFNNIYKDSCGAFIRTEIWACIAPGSPLTAVRYAYEDSIVDHGNGEGTFAAVFVAALESAAFVVSDIRKLIEIGLSYILPECGVTGAVKAAIEAYDCKKTWLEARDDILRGYRGDSAAGVPELTMPEDRKKGFHEGKRGWDAPSNIGLLVLSLLYGEGDFGNTICTAVNCGEDTDCTGATAGSIFGIIHGIESIPEKWITPIGRTIKTLCVNLGDIGGAMPRDVDELTRRTERVCRQVLLDCRLPIELVDSAPSDLSGTSPESLLAPDPKARKVETLLTAPWAPPVYDNLNATVQRFDFFEVAVDYGDGPTVRDGQPKPICLRIRNIDRVQENLNIHWYLPPGWTASPSSTGKVFIPHGWLALGSTIEVPYTLCAEQVQGDIIRCVVEITITGRPTVMLVPVALVNSNLVVPA
jgi:ADP-ribosylglycohydrolase